MVNQAVKVVARAQRRFVKVKVECLSKSFKWAKVKGDQLPLKLNRW